MSAASKPQSSKSSHSTESEWDDTVSIVVVALIKGFGLLMWWSILFPMISVPP